MKRFGSRQDWGEISVDRQGSEQIGNGSLWRCNLWLRAVATNYT